MFVEEVDGPVDAEAAFLALFGDAETAFWLDGEVASPEGARVSHLGDASGPGAHLLRAAAGAGSVEIVTPGGVETVAGDVLCILARRLGPRSGVAPGDRLHDGETGADSASRSAGRGSGPLGGYVGYLSYEIGADCGAEPTGRNAYPDAQWLFLDRLVSIDHATGRAVVSALAGSSPDEAAAQREWVRATAARLGELAVRPFDPAARETASPPVRNPEPGPARPPLDPGAGEAHLVRDRGTYLRDVRACLAALRAGESYEICLTNALDLPAPADPLAFYRRLRRANPAPYAAYLRVGDLTVASSSPERFLRVSGGVAESRPIKGTAPRGATPAEDDAIREALAADPKTRAENLMIVDLLRNDLTRVCEVGTVSTHGLMAVETYATVHQMVTTIRGRLAAGVSTADAVRACFPGGSMTGAPKRRTTQICAELEGAPRGVYSGALGWIGADAADLAVVIRTAVVHDGRCRIGAGGAIVLDSDPVAEYDEMLLKAAATLRAYRP